MTRQIFVFGSNLAGIHGAGSARAAVEQHFAIYGQGVGLQGESYAIPTKDENIESLPLDVVEKHVRDFVKFAEQHTEMTFNVVKIGCGLAGFKEEQIAPMFFGAPTNVRLPDGWRNIADQHRWMWPENIHSTLKDFHSKEKTDGDGQAEPKTPDVP